MKIVIAILVCAVIGLGYVAIHNSKPLRCDEVIQYEDGSVVCEVFIRPSVNPVDVQNNGVKEGYRL